MKIYVVAVNTDYENMEQAIAAFSKKEDAQEFEKRLKALPYADRGYGSKMDKVFQCGSYDNVVLYELDIDKKFDF